MTESGSKFGLDSRWGMTENLPAETPPPKRMTITRLALNDVLLIEPKRFGDARGFFMETFREDRLAEFGFTAPFIQDNHSLSAPAGTLRGLHFQKAPHAQDKLVRVVRGEILDVAVDIRTGSPTYGRHVAEKLTAENGRQLLVPKGFAHAFVTLVPDTEVVYKVTDYYAPDCDSGIAWNDPDLGIDWGLTGEPVLSGKDGELGAFADLPSGLFPYGEF